MSETQVRGRSFAGLRSTLIGYGVLAFTFFPPTRALMLWGVGAQIAVIVARKLVERQVRDPAIAGQALMVIDARRHQGNRTTNLRSHR
jgi:hypothetical protein